MVIDPNLTTPADGYVHAIGYGNEPIKVRLTDGFACVKFDTQDEGTDNAATCLIAGATSFGFVTDELNTEFHFPDGNPTFVANFEVSECLSLTDPISGGALVDVPLADCKITLDSELPSLDEPGRIEVDFFTDSRWDTGPFSDARLNLLQFDDAGVAVLPPSVAPTPSWFGTATTGPSALRWIENGLGRLAAFFGVKPLYAPPGAGWDFTRMSDFQIALMPVMDHGVGGGTACSSGLASCLNLGTIGGVDPEVEVSVDVTAPDDSDPGGSPGTQHFAVQDTRLHFFPSDGGSVACPTSSPAGETCVAALANDNSTIPASTWDHVVVITGTSGTGTVDWTLAPGANKLDVSACGVARPGAFEANPSDTIPDGVWGTLDDCTDREAALTASPSFDNGPADGFTPFEPVDTRSEVAIYGLPLTFEAKTCPQITVDGVKGLGGAEWDECADTTSFIAPLKGKKSTVPNAKLYTYDDGTTFYMALEVNTNDLGNKIFINLVESFDGDDGVAAAGDELLVLDFGDLTEHPFGEASDWHFTQACVGNNSSSLCGDPDSPGGDGVGKDVEAAATSDGSPSGVFYEFSRPLGSLNDGEGDTAKEDLFVPVSKMLGLRLRVTQGKGGGKGGFVYPDPQTSPVIYHKFTIN